MEPKVAPYEAIALMDRYVKISYHLSYLIVLIMVRSVDPFLIIITNVMLCEYCVFCRFHLVGWCSLLNNTQFSKDTYFKFS